MRVVVRSLACLAALTSIAFAAPEGARPLPTYHLHGFYKLHGQIGVWQRSDDAPWQVVKDQPWINDIRILHWGYVPIVHDSERYYCLIDDHPRIGTHIGRKTFICGDPVTVEMIFNDNQTPTVLSYGGE